MITEPLFSNKVPDWTPLGSGSHLFAIFDQQGEHIALADAYANGNTEHVPMFHFAGPRKPTKKGEQQRPITRAQLRGFAKRVKETVGNRPVYIDVYGTQMNKAIKQELKRTVLDKPIPELFKACRGEGIHFMPVHDVLKPSLYREPVKSAIKAEGRGAAFRLRLNGTIMKPDGSVEAKLIDELNHLEVTCDEIDLVLDLGFLDVDSELRADLYAAIVDRLRAMGNWRSIVLLGSSIPRMMSDVKPGQVGKLMRHEYNLWRELRAIGRDLVLGDYGVQHPAPPLEKMGPGGYASVRYTVDEYTLVSRGPEPLLESGDPHGQYLYCCERLVGHRLFAEDEDSPADVEIEACSSDGKCATLQTDWRRIGMQRHLLVVRDQLK